MTEEMVHVWNRCHHCGQSPIEGRRFHCQTCPDGPDNDLCESCHERYLAGEFRHPAPDTAAAVLSSENHHFSPIEGKPPGPYEEWLRIDHPEMKAPVLPNRFVVRPIFSAGLDAVIGGYAFAVRLEGGTSPVLLTALHVLDEMIKKNGIDATAANKEYTGRELPGIITEVTLYDVFAPNWMTAPLGSAGAMFVLPEARTGEDEPFADLDIAAFRLPDTRDLNPAPLADAVPGVGEPVWGVSKLDGKPSQRTLKAVVVEVTDRSLVFRFDNPEDADRARYSSGSPMINQQGEVIGIRIGGGNFRQQKFGHANHTANIRRHLTNALP